MSTRIETLSIADASDGTGVVPGSDAKGHKRNDRYFQEKLAERWMKEEGRLHPGVTYRLDRLPTGYTGWQKAREGTNQVDRYVYGHPRGHFRSLNELYPHFKHLQEFGGSVGCECPLCKGRTKKPKGSNSDSISTGSGSPAGSSKFFHTPPAPVQNRPKTKPKPGRFDSDTTVRGKQSDVEGVPDIYRTLLDRVKEAGEKGLGFEPFVDALSPDWRAGHEMLQQLFGDWSKQPSYIPRVGELVLFTRTLSPEQTMHWDPSVQALRRMDRDSNTWLDRPKWEVGVVTQLPLETITEDDLLGIPTNKTQSVPYSGFRIEPLSEPGQSSKPWTSQHKYVPLHALRPFTYWKDCIGGSEESWHPTVKHALTLANSICVVGKYSFTGKWPEATLFVRAMYLGPELILVGDAVRLMPQSPDSKHSTVVDVMVVSSIRIRFVDLEEANDDDYDDEVPYKTCVHVYGKTYSLDPKRSFGGIGRSPVKKDQKGFPPGLHEYGAWFNVVDPNNALAKLEVPFTRVLGKCFDYGTIQAWFSVPPTNTLSSSFQSVNSATAKPKTPTLQLGLPAMREARAYSVKHDSRIDRANGKSWFWAETRIEQLDLHEINGHFVGVKDKTRTKRQMHAWREALKVMDGKKGGLEEYHAAREMREDKKRRESAGLPSSAWGMMASAVQADSGNDAERVEEDIMEVEAEERGETGDDEAMVSDQGGGIKEEGRAAPGVFHGLQDEDVIVIDDD